MNLDQGNAPRTAATRHRVIAEAHLVALDSGRVLLTRRCNTAYGNGHWHLPSGHLEPGESITATLIREAKEELGITLAEDSIEFAHVMHRDDDAGRMGFFWTAAEWEGTPAILEPDKCDGLDWFLIDRLPEPMIDYHQQALTEIQAGRTFSQMGW
ncbi:NUDIX hydrolase [Glycomyces salinus]|uniref:NUDIX hydrolase n=1 Tax=Glycomyces salinus TaxID=980294 RepID=UPI0018EDB0C9|nr:NUDIX domain-containing protein [Glycomyces salinus]